MTALFLEVCLSCGDDDAEVASTNTVAHQSATATSGTSGRALVTTTALAAAAPVTTAAPAPSGVPSDFAADPPDVTLRTDGDAIVVGPHSWGNFVMAADGTTLPPHGPSVVIESTEVVVDYPLGGWTIFARADGAAAGSIQLTVEPIGTTSFRLVPPAAGTYDVWLTAEYEAQGNRDRADAGYVFRWVVP